MADMRVMRQVVPDDGTDGFFWRKGERWLREDGVEQPLRELAPDLEPRRPIDAVEAAAREASQPRRDDEPLLPLGLGDSER